MAYVVMSTQVTGYVVLASDWNEMVNNFVASAPDVFTTDGDIFVATAANAGKRLGAMGSGDTFIHEVGGWELDISALTTNDTVGGASSGVAEIKTPVTQAEAEGGSNTRFSLWSSLRVKQAVAAQGVAAASQAEMEAASSTTVAATPGRTQNHPGVAKWWAMVTQTGTQAIDASHNLTSIADNGTGLTTFTIATDFSGASWAAFASGDDAFMVFLSGGTRTAGVIRVDARDNNTVAQDSIIYIGGFGDQ